MQRRSASKNEHEKSPRVLMLVEYAARRMVIAISSVAFRNAFLRTSNVIGSMPWIVSPTVDMSSLTS